MDSAQKSGGVDCCVVVGFSGLRHDHWQPLRRSETAIKPLGRFVWGAPRVHSFGILATANAWPAPVKPTVMMYPDLAGCHEIR